MIPPELASKLQSIHATLQRGDAASARSAISPLVTAHAGEATVVQLAAMIERAAGDLGAARDVVTRGIAAGAFTPQLGNMLGNILRDLKDDAAADAAYGEAIAADPTYVDPYINRGQLAASAGDHDAAIRWLREACRIAPRSALAHVSLGNALRQRGDHAEAVEMLRQAQAIDPARATTSLHLGVALNAAGDPRGAIAAYERARAAGLDSPELANNRAAALIELGDIDGAFRLLDGLTASAPAYMAGHHARARLVWEFGIDRDPFESFAALARSYPREPIVWESWCAALSGFRQYDKAAEIAARGIAATGGTPTLHLASAMAHSEEGQLDAADAGFAAACGVLGARSDYRVALTRHLLRRRDPARAAAEAQACCDADPTNQLAWAYLGTAWRLLGDPREHWLHDYERHVGLIELAPETSDAGEVVERIATALRRLHITRNHPADQTLRNGTQTAGALFTRPEPEIAELKAMIARAVRGYIDALPSDDAHPMLNRKSTDFRFSGSWSVRLGRSGFHINHVHSDGWISSACYFALPPDDPADAPDAGALQLGAPPEELGLDLPYRRIITPRVGALALFPSSMWHGTLPFSGDAERLTVAFDVVPAR
ncbi:putative 2OG-Fe(II) oxygenase [Sphingomonas sp. ST-64]|uniref:2OG-Fe(II) oxygenase n=1 Tax=Sphingomonas plantiphila TaxID=3163295 RepID=A0ABW8YMF0_9SPHN